MRIKRRIRPSNIEFYFCILNFSVLFLFLQARIYMKTRLSMKHECQKKKVTNSLTWERICSFDVTKTGERRKLFRLRHFWCFSQMHTRALHMVKTKYQCFSSLNSIMKLNCATLWRCRSTKATMSHQNAVSECCSEARKPCNVVAI